MLTPRRFHCRWLPGQLPQCSMPTLHPLYAALALFSSVALVVGQGATQGTDPIDLVARAEGFFAKGAKEDAILMLWDAVEQLGSRTEQPASAAGLKAALGLLRANDSLHEERLATLLAQARAQTDLAMVYRGKKWFRSATEHLDLADQLDAKAGQKERAQLARANPTYVEPSISEPRGYSLLKRLETVRAEGPWREVGDTLECGSHPARTPWYEWTVDARHADCELALEFCSSDPKVGHDCSLLVGVDSGGASYQFIAAYYAESGRYDLVLYEHKDKQARLLGSALVGSLPAGDGFHRLSLRVNGTSLRAQLDAAPPVEVTVPAAPRGRFAIAVGIDNQDSAPITIRNFQLRPWPLPTEEEQRANRHAEAQKRIAEAIDGASLLIARKENEAAALRLRVARNDAARLLPGVLRDNLIKSIEEMLVRADPLDARCKKVGQEGVRALVGVADRYAAAGHLRAALHIVQQAARIDAEACAPRLQAAQQAVASLQKQEDR